MNEPMYLQSGKQRQQEMMREAERERLAAEAKRARKKRADRRGTSNPGWALRRLGGRLLKTLRPWKNTG